MCVCYCNVLSMDWFIKSKICGIGDSEKGMGGVEGLISYVGCVLQWCPCMCGDGVFTSDGMCAGSAQVVLEVWVVVEDIEFGVGEGSIEIIVGLVGGGVIKIRLGSLTSSLGFGFRLGLGFGLELNSLIL